MELPGVGSPQWLTPGCGVTWIWVEEEPRPRPGGSRVYSIAGPFLEDHADTGYFLLAPAGHDAFVESVYRGEASVEDLRRLLARCSVAPGWLSDDRDAVTVSEEVPVLGLLDTWRSAPAGEIVSYVPDIEGVLARSGFLPLTVESHRRLEGQGETLATAWVCEECEDPRDRAVVLWTAPSPVGIRACLLIEITGGVWRCRLHPFDLRAGSTAGAV